MNTDKRFWYPRFDGVDLCWLRAGGPGLGNLMFVWARALVLARRHGGQLVAPIWAQLKLGPMLRRELDWRTYMGLFRADESDLRGIRRWWRLWFSSRTSEAAASGHGDVAKGLIEVRGMGAQFQDLQGEQVFLRQAFIRIQRRPPSARQMQSMGGVIAVHVRLGDFALAAAGHAPGQTNTRVAIDWYVAAVLALRVGLGQELPVLVFSDGRDDEIAPLLRLPKVSRHVSRSAANDIILMGCAAALVASGSTFSAWASFLGQLPTVWYPGQLKQALTGRPDHEVELGDDPLVLTGVLQSIRRHLAVQPAARRALDLHVVQPTVPHYRLAFFKALAAACGPGLRIWAARRLESGPSSVPVEDLPEVDFRDHCEIRSWVGGRVLWQRGVMAAARRPCDVLVLTGNPRFISIFPLWLLASWRHIPVVWWGHVRSSTSTPRAMSVRLRLMRMADAILVYTEAEKQQLVAAGWPAERIFFTNNGLDRARIDAARGAVEPDRLRVLRESMGIGESDPVVLFTGRLTPKARLDVLLHAIHKLRQDLPRVHLLLIGDGAEAERIDQLIGVLGLETQVHRLGAVEDEYSLAGFFEIADCYAYAGEVGLSLLHALYYGLPVVVHGNRVRHNPEIAAMREGVNGLTFTEGSADSLAEVLRRLLLDRALRDSMNGEAAQAICREFSIDTMVDGMLRACDAVALGAADKW